MCDKNTRFKVAKMVYPEIDQTAEQLQIQINQLQKLLDECGLEHQSCQSQNVSLVEKIQLDNETIDKLQIAKNALQLQLNQINAVDEEKQRLNAEYPKFELIYRNKRYITNTYNDKVWLSYDVREFIYGNDYLLKRICSEIFSTYNPPNEEKLVSAVNSWVANNTIKYELDSYLHGVDDYYQYPEETLALTHGDCEDTSFLVISLLRSFGVPAHRLRVNFGVVYGKYGHAYVQYYNGTDWLLVETTMPWHYENPLEKMADHSEYHTYQSFNDEFSWLIDSGMTFGEMDKKLTETESRAFQRSNDKSEFK